ncbi:uncharacterized protein SCHCODRAFT_02267188 [Schizophyllum commune H4-8]|uniref:uncharacterized protein n=1 Tax=Schizophyllum commune (strain H4-8 / FGSC 9210) TaxID=578458 RepID=UPI00215E0A4E|nr:uncharacterized protein SCHCODRAFT_02267188 [Schizophyllum commune H4-8]KAI5894031.1 hypothetical protein SCHCODRAFT_02267188 [Schizophyllum commune H4-8]
MPFSPSCLSRLLRSDASIGKKKRRGIVDGGHPTSRFAMSSELRDAFATLGSAFVGARCLFSRFYTPERMVAFTTVLFALRMFIPCVCLVLRKRKLGTR